MNLDEKLNKIEELGANLIKAKKEAVIADYEAEQAREKLSPAKSRYAVAKQEWDAIEEISEKTKVDIQKPQTALEYRKMTDFLDAKGLR